MKIILTHQKMKLKNQNTIFKYYLDQVLFTAGKRTERNKNSDKKDYLLFSPEVL